MTVITWADERPEALQELIAPTIKLVDEEVSGRWALPAGWVRIVNDLHFDLVALIGAYRVVRVTNKMSALRYAIDTDYGSVWGEVNDRIEEAKKESLSTCELCGGPAEGRLSFGSTRCEDHESIPGVRARPPRSMIDRQRATGWTVRGRKLVLPPYYQDTGPLGPTDWTALTLHLLTLFERVAPGRPDSSTSPPSGGDTSSSRRFENTLEAELAALDLAWVDVEMQRLMKHVLVRTNRLGQAVQRFPNLRGIADVDGDLDPSRLEHFHGLGHAL